MPLPASSLAAREAVDCRFQGLTLHELPPNGQDIAALMALGMLGCWDLGRHGVDSAESMHLQVEVMKLAFADVYRSVADPGVVVGSMQPQGHVQVMVRLADYRQNPQAAWDAPRWKVRGGVDVELEAWMDAAEVAKLQRLGHRLTDPDQTNYFDFGADQFVRGIPAGYLAASDPRRDGQAVGF
jgi:gamma-glutamyltranspeptidase